MADSVPVTDLLNALRAGDVEAGSDLFRYFLDAAQRCARRHIDATLQRRVDADAVGASGLRVSLELAQRPSARFRGRADFVKLLNRVTPRKAVSAVRRETADKRDAYRDVDLGQGSKTADPFAKPEIFVMTNELAVRAVQLLLSEQDAVRRTIYIRGIVDGVSAAHIERELAVDGHDPPSKSTILSLIRRRRRKLIVELGGEDNSDEHPTH